MSFFSLVWGRAVAAFPILGVAGILSSVSGPGALEAGESRIELRDGSVLSAELVAVEAGRYRIRNSLIGEIEVEEGDVLAIRPSAAMATGEPVGGIADVQRRIVGSPDILGSVTGLRGDPELQAALSDPDLLRLVMSGDLEALRSDPRLLRLMEHPAIQAIVRQLIAP